MILRNKKTGVEYEFNDEEYAILKEQGKDSKYVVIDTYKTTAGRSKNIGNIGDINEFKPSYIDKEIKEIIEKNKAKQKRSDKKNK